jgi:hypothetical protein
MLMKRSLWLWASLAVVALAVLILHSIAPHHVEAPVSKPIPDLSVTSPLNQQGGEPLEVDSYEVYAGLYQAPQQEPLAIAEDSLTDIPQVDGSCLKTANAEERALADAFVAANLKSHRWEKHFSIPSEYTLLSAAESKTAEACIESHGAGADCARYKSLRHVRYLGVPGFDHTHTRALVSVVKKCGRYCGAGGIFVAEKTGGVWHRAEASDLVRECSWMY